MTMMTTFFSNTKIDVRKTKDEDEEISSPFATVAIRAFHPKGDVIL